CSSPRSSSRCRSSSSGGRSTRCGSGSRRPRPGRGAWAPSRGASKRSVEFLLGVLTGAHSLDDLIRWGGYAVLVGIVFTETGLLKPRPVRRTRRFYECHGAKTIVIARFVPIIRTFAPVVAGVGQMRYRRFLVYNVAGGVGWVTSMTWMGYLLGRAVPNIADYIHIVVIVVIVVSMIPIVVEILRE